MRKLPQALIVMDPILDKNAVIEARKLNIPVIALANTNANPDMIDYIIPINNNSFRTMWLVLSVLVDAITSASNEATKIVGKTDEEIILPETMRRKRTFVPGQSETNNQTPVKNEVKEEKTK